MTPYQLYVSDDALPLFPGDGFLRNEDVMVDSVLRHVLQDSRLDWTEPVVKDFLEKAVANPQWHVCAARNPEFFLKTFENSLDKPDVLVFDWDYPGLPKSSEEFLAEFLQKSYCIVRIYTGVEKVQEIEDVLKKERFQQYQSRVSVSEKSEVDAEALLKQVQEKQSSSFSHAFGARLRRTTLESLEQILVSLGRNSIDEVMSLLNTMATTESDFKEILVEKIRNHLKEDETLIKFLTERRLNASDAQALINLIAEKLRNDLNSADIQLVPPNPGGLSAGDPKVAEAATRLWSYRLYHQPSDDSVRRGDIVQRASDREYFLVVSADCDLNRIWQKNYGHITLVPAYELKKDCAKVLARFRLANLKIETANFATQSLTGTPTKLADGTLVLPFVPLDSGFSNFLLFPKEIIALEISPPVSAGDDVAKIRSFCLTYEFFTGFKRVRSISEPFLTPLVHTLIEALSGLGVPDYPTPVKKAIDDRSKAGFV